MSKRITTADFIRRARRVHGDRYNYSKVVYRAAVKNVTIICPDHGEFEQRPTNHYIGHGCHECGGNKRLTLDRFIERANKIHANRYDYSRVVLKNVDTKVEIICPIHQSFFQRPASHLKGFGCENCGRAETGKKLALSLDDFLEASLAAHGEFYDYSRVDYQNANRKVTICCPKHGSFEQRPSNHMEGVGCPKCGDESTAEKRTKSLDEYLREAREAHGNRYEYSKVVYKTSDVKIEVVCNVHGSFWVLPHNHTSKKSGCPACAESGFDPSEPGILYYIAVQADDGDTRYKIGVTNLTVEKRFPAADLARIRVVKIWRYSVGRVAAEREAEILHQFAGDRYFGADLLAGAGNTELFTHDVLGLDRLGVKDTGQMVGEDGALINRPTQIDIDFGD